MRHPQKGCWRKDLNPQPSDYKSDALPVELLQQKEWLLYQKEDFSEHLFLAKVFCCRFEAFIRVRQVALALLRLLFACFEFDRLFCLFLAKIALGHAELKLLQCVAFAGSLLDRGRAAENIEALILYLEHFGFKFSFAGGSILRRCLLLFFFHAAVFVFLAGAARTGVVSANFLCHVPPKLKKGAILSNLLDDVQFYLLLYFFPYAGNHAANRTASVEKIGQTSGKRHAQSAL